DQQCAGARLNDGRKCSIDFAWGFGVQAQEMTPEVASRGVHITLFYLETCITWIAQPGDGGRRRHQLMQQLEAFRLQRAPVKLTAVILPPSRLRLVTRPVAIGSPPLTNTIGMVEVTARAARMETFGPTIQATCRCARCGASAGS